jgi:peptidoglycan hydrolase-like protein with peptidoglycan-binding domain
LPVSKIEEKGMLLVGKAACVGLTFLLLTIGISGPRPTLPTLRSNLSPEAPQDAHPNDVKEVQQTLQDKGHYRGQVDGVFGLRTRASIRAYQRAENLPITGKLDAETARKLGITAEVRDETGYETTQGKPSAGIKSAKGFHRTRQTLREPEKIVTAPESGRGEREKKLRAEIDSQRQ